MSRSSKHRISEHVIRACSYFLAVLTLFPIRAWLAVPTAPFDLSSGWKPFAAWTLVFAGFASVYGTILHFFAPAERPSQPDLYTVAQAEIEAERATSAESTTASDEHPTRTQVA